CSSDLANVLFMLALGPVLAAALGTLAGEPVSGRTWLAIGIALGGLALMVGGPGRPGALGASLAFVCALSFAGALVITRHLRELSMAAATCLSQRIVRVARTPCAHPRQLYG